MTNTATRHWAYIERSTDEFLETLGLYSDAPRIATGATAKKGEGRCGVKHLSDTMNDVGQCRDIVLKALVLCRLPTSDELSWWERPIWSQVWRNGKTPLLTTGYAPTPWTGIISGELGIRSRPRCHTSTIFGGE